MTNGIYGPPLSIKRIDENTGYLLEIMYIFDSCYDS